MITTTLRYAAVTLIGMAAAGCAVASAHVPVDPATNFAAHTEHGGIVVDRMADSGHAVLVANGLPFSRRPSFLLQNGDRDVAALWSDGAGAVVREPAGETGRRVGDVDASWREGAIRLTFHPNGHDAFHTGAFHRAGWGSPELLGQPATNILDLPGVYRAEVRDAGDRPVGWMRVEIGRYGPVMRVYDGDLPASINGPLAVAAVEQLDSDIDWVEQHAVNPYIGN